MIYFISPENDFSVVKIGYTSNLETRLRALNTSSHAEMVVRLTIEGGREKEALLHYHFRTLRINREWFDVDENIKEIIKTGYVDWDRLAKRKAFDYVIFQEGKEDREMRIWAEHVKNNGAQNHHLDAIAAKPISFRRKKEWSKMSSYYRPWIDIVYEERMAARGIGMDYKLPGDD